ncbi:MAG: hypothetical protein K6347_06895 [Campylobacterales bacterium]
MRRAVTELFISFAIGACWAVGLLGAVLLFFSIKPFGIAAALTSALVALLAGGALAAIFELFSSWMQSADEAKRQRELLEEILSELRRLQRSGDEKLSDY